MFAFAKVADVYTLNFIGDKCGQHTQNTTYNPANLPFFDYFLPTYPIFTIFSSYTVVSLTLINNLKALTMTKPESWVNYIMPLLALIPSVVVTLFTEDVVSIVGYVGSYTGTLVQYVFPALLGYYGRKVVIERHLVPYLKKKTTLDPDKLDMDHIYARLNPMSSVFQGDGWFFFTGFWWIFTLLIVTVDHMRSVLHF